MNVKGLADQMVKQNRGRLKHTFTHVLQGFSAKLPDRAIAALKKNPRVRLVERDGVAKVDSVDQLSPPSWGLDRIDQQLLPLNSRYTAGNNASAVHAFILDTGIRSTHSEFTGRIYPGYNAILDSQGTEDCHDHGTHVAGTVGGTRYGVAKNVRLYPVRVLDCSGNGSWSGMISALDWVVKSGKRPAVANMSIGGSVSTSLNEAIATATSSGVSVVVSAGNKTADACEQSPASAPSAITVGATGTSDSITSFSNFGSCVDLFAPGQNIQSAYYSSDTAIVGMNGTSMAAPHATGVAALYLAANPGASPAQVASALTSNATANRVSGLPAGTANKLLYSGFIGSAGDLQPPPPPPPPAENTAPVASFSVSCPKGGPTCSVDGSGSSDDKGIVRYEWSFGDGSASIVTSTPRASYTYKALGTYSISLKVLDFEGLTGSSSRSMKIRKR